MSDGICKALKVHRDVRRGMFEPLRVALSDRSHAPKAPDAIPRLPMAEEAGGES
jgi:hypothetical protein